MPILDSAFRHVPELRGRMVDPDQSRLRLTLERFAEMDAEAEKLGRAPDWRLPHEEREADRKRTLGERLGGEVWIFAYGSLIWDPGVHFDEVRRARLDRRRRRFCMHLEMGRGSPEAPGLMAALDDCPEGRACEGIALRIPAALADAETEILWRREMISGAYRPEFLPADTPQGPIEALVFSAKHDHWRYVDVKRDEAARRIATAQGVLGPNIEYLENLVAGLDALGIEDPDMRDLLSRAHAQRPGVPAG